MFLKITLLGLLLSVCLANPQQGYGYRQPPPLPPQRPQPLYRTPVTQAPRTPPPPPPPPPANAYGAPTNIGSVRVDPPKRADPPMEGMPYDFTWGVEDPDSGNQFSHVENSDGRRTEGEYRVLLPDGRTQVVKFYDDGNGFNAEVTYE